MMYFNAVITACSRFRKSISHIFTEDDSIVLSEATITIGGLQNILIELVIDQESTKVIQDIKGSIEYGKAVWYINKRKHINNRYNYTMSSVESGR